LLHLAFPKRSIVVNNSAFSLVELLVVMAIIGMMVGLSALAVSGMRAPAVQHAADQVMSGLSLARQIAITKNTQAALLIADQTTTGFPTNGPYRHWSVVYSNKGATTWTIAKDWEELPNGAVFYEVRGAFGSTPGYSSLNAASNAMTQVPGDIIPASNFTSRNASTNFSIVTSGNTTTATIPCIRFKSDGSVANASTAGMAVRIVPGSVMGGNATLTGNQTYYFVETDSAIGRIRMRAPESYKN
jgi:prepilin-type N-terminal cleavage/methylation domain-containing protein